MSRLLVITHEPLGVNMSGPGIRSLEIARALADRHDVTLATPFQPGMDSPPVRLARYSFDNDQTLLRLATDSDVLLVQGFTLSRFPAIARLERPIIVDLYCPFTLERLETMVGEARAGDPERAVLDHEWSEAEQANVAQITHAQNTQIRRGDFFVCASERQRDFWLGMLHAAGRINPWTYGSDSTLRSLIDVVPFGLPAAPPQRIPAPVLKGVFPGIDVNDRVLLWAGSLLDWQDPKVLVRAVALLRSRRPDVKLFFMGTRHPNPQIPPPRSVAETVALAGELGVLNVSVFFNDWVAYDERARYLLESDIGVSTHRDHLETRFSFRTRMLDYLWAGLPIVCTDGDVFASMVNDHRLGLTVPPGNVSALADAIERLLGDPLALDECRQRLLEQADHFRWRTVVAPIARFCAAPHLASDRIASRRVAGERLERRLRYRRLARAFASRIGLSDSQVRYLKGLTQSLRGRFGG